jgi:hypothetical protein
MPLAFEHTAVTKKQSVYQQDRTSIHSKTSTIIDSSSDEEEKSTIPLGSNSYGTFLPEQSRPDVNPITPGVSVVGSKDVHVGPKVQIPPGAAVYINNIDPNSGKDLICF